MATPPPVPPGSGPSRRPGVFVFALVGTLLLVAATVGIVAFQASSPSLSLAQAKTAFDQTWPEFADGFARGNAVELQDTTTPEMLQVVAGYYQCGCGTWAADRSRPTIVVPDQHSYPLSFLADVPTVDPEGNTVNQVAVLTRSGVDDRWRVAYMVPSARSQPFVPTDASGTSDAPAGSGAPGTPAASLAPDGTQLAALFQAMANTGMPPAGELWPVSGAIKQKTDDFVATKQAVVAGGDDQQTVFGAVDPTRTFTFPTGAIACGAIRSTSTVTTPPGKPTIQSPDRSPWSDELPPGTYRSITKYGINDYCVYDGILGGHEPVAFLGGVYRMVGHT